MSIISVAPAVPNRLQILFGLLYERDGGETRARLEALVTPPALRSKGGAEDGEGSTTLFDSTIREARSLGLLEEVDGKWRVGIETRDDRGHRMKPEAAFRRHLRQVLFDSVVAQQTRQDAFIYALAWFLMQNPREPLPFGESPKSKLERQIGTMAEKCELTNLNRFQNFVYWGRYLGFATIAGLRDSSGSKDSKWVFPDPMRAIEDVLPSLFADSEEMRIGDFIASLAKVYPVFETGAVRAELEELARPGFGADSERRLSVATSLALKRLEDGGVIELPGRADAAVVVLDLGDDTRRVSHVIFKD